MGKNEHQSNTSLIFSLLPAQYTDGFMFRIDAKSYQRKKNERKREISREKTRNKCRRALERNSSSLDFDIAWQSVYVSTAAAKLT